MIQVHIKGQRNECRDQGACNFKYIKQINKYGLNFQLSLKEKKRGEARRENQPSSPRAVHLVSGLSLAACVCNQKQDIGNERIVDPSKIK